MKTIILVWGSAERGKSQSIKRLAMKMPFSTFISPWHNDDYDSYVIGKVKGNEGEEHVIGVESQGDPYSNQKAWIEKCIAADCEVIVAASRTYGQTVRDAYQLAHDNGYEVVEVTTHFHVGGPKLPNGVDLRDVFAENMVSLIMRCI